MAEFDPTKPFTIVEPEFDPTKPFTIVSDEKPVEEEPEKEDQQFYDDTLIGELGEGVASGFIKLGEGIAGLAAIPVDVAYDTDYGDQITKASEDLRDAMGLDPEGFVGKGSEILSQFVYLPLKAAGMAGRGYQAARAARLGKAKAAKTPLTRSERFGLAAAQLGAAGAAEVAVTTDGTTTIGDWVEMGPTQTEDLIGLRGQEKALGRIRNRLRSTAEATGIGAGIGAAIGSLGRTSAGQAIAKTLTDKIDAAGAKIDNLIYRRATAAPGSAEELGVLGKLGADIASFARYRGSLPDEAATQRYLIEGQVEAELGKAERVVKQLDKQVKLALKKAKPTSQLDRVSIMSKVNEFLTEADLKTQSDIFNQLPVEIRPNVREMRDHVDELQKVIRDGPFLRGNPVTPSGVSVKEIIDESIGSYLRRGYRAFEDAKYVPDQTAINTARGFFKGNKTATEKELTQLAQRDPFNEILTDDFMTRNGLQRVTDDDGVKIVVPNKVTSDVARVAQEAFLSKYAVRARGKLGGGRVARDRLDTSLFIDRENIPKALRQLLGEIDDPKQAYLSTVADLAQFNAVDNYYDSIAQMAKNDEGIGRLFVNPKSPQQEAGLVQRGYVKLGSNDAPSMVKSSTDEKAVDELVKDRGWGSLSGYYVPKAIHRDLTNAVLAEDSVGALLTRYTIGAFLKGKGISQYSKTVLSPITQVRNFTTAVGFALANGNVPMIGRGGSLSDSAKLVFSNITNRGSDAVFDDLFDAQKRGVLGTNAELREIQDTLSKGVDVTARGPRSFADTVLGERLGGALRGVTKPAEDLYQGSDDFWKYFNYHAEQAKLRNALKGATEEQQIAYLTKGQGSDLPVEELIKDRAAQIVRDTVPNYSKAASEAIRYARRLPVGNFITFPAEMYRTSFNIVRQALSDMASDIPAIQARGRQRLIGFTTVAGVAPMAALDLGSAISGVSKDMMEAYKRSFGASWEQGSVLVPIDQDEDGKLRYFNFSTSNPYDSLFRFANRAFTEVERGVEQKQDIDKVVFDTMVGTLGELFSPFFGEAMLTEALVDITARGGRTKTGAQVYNPEDNDGLKIQKMFNHVLDTMLPNVIPVNVSSGEFEPSRFLRGVVGSKYPDLIDPEDKFGRERNAQEEIIRQFVGVTPLEFDPKKNIVFAAKRLKRAQDDARRIFNSRTDDGNATGESLYNAFVASNQAKLRVDREYYQMLKDAQELGLSQREIRKILQEENIGGWKTLIKGKFTPMDVTDEQKRKMRKAGVYSEFDRRLARDLRRTFKNIPLDVRGAPEAPEFDAQPEPSIVDPFAALPAAPAPQPAAPAPVPTMPTAPAPQAQPQSNTRSLPFLGSNPIDALRNMEILQRISGGQ